VLIYGLRWNEARVERSGEGGIFEPKRGILSVYAQYCLAIGIVGWGV